MKRVVIPLILIALLVVGCQSAAPPPVVHLPDMVPVGDGLKVLGFAFLGAAVVLTLGRLLR